MRRQSRRRLLRGSLAVAGLGLASGCGLLTPVARPARIHRIGYLDARGATAAGLGFQAFREGLRELGYLEGQNVTLEPRYADGSEDALPALAVELARLPVDVIVTAGAAGIAAAQRATRTIPIIFATSGDPVDSGFVASLARPGGNTTGLTVLAGREHARRLELLKETVPTLSRVAVLSSQNETLGLRQIQAAAPAMGLQVLPLQLSQPSELGALLAGASAEGADGLVQSSGSVISNFIPEIVDYAARVRLPTIYEASSAAGAGGFMQYGPRIVENFRRAATYVDKILKGANPGEIPVERPTQYDFVINLKAAQALGLTIPPSVLAQATEVIQ